MSLSKEVQRAISEQVGMPFEKIVELDRFHEEAFIKKKNREKA